MHIYSGYFTSLDNVNYKMSIVPKDNDGIEQEILMSGSQPFTVDIENGGSPFEPMRKSTASINIISTSYLTDVFSPHAQGTAVYLYNLNNNTTEWRGYLKPNLYNQPYENCTETISLEASDALSSLQYLKYEPKIAGVKSIVDFHYLIDYICLKAGIPEWHVMRNKCDKESNEILPKDLIISEKNFFSSDTDEPWTLETLLEELMKYMGYTAYQWKGDLWLTDYAMFSNDVYAPGMYDEMSYMKYSVGSTGGTAESVTCIGEVYADNFRSSSADVSMDNIYNKIKVKDNLYEVEGLFPDIFDENALVPRLGDANKALEMPIIQEQICNSSGKFVDDAGDSKHIFFTKPYDHPQWESVYYEEKNGALYEDKTLTSDDLKNDNLLRGRVGGTIVDTGDVNSTEATYDISSSLNFDKYLYLNMKDKNEVVWVFSYKMKDSEDGDWNEFVKINYNLKSPETYKTLYRLKSGYHLPMILGDNTFLALQVSAKMERHGLGYINPDWSSEAGGWYKGCKSQTYIAPELIFLLKIGNQWWNGEGWQDTACAFLVPLSFSRDENMKPDGKDWNTGLNHFNNVPWSDWAAIDGVKIPLDNVRDLLGEVKFEVKMPPKMLIYSGGTDKGVKNGSCWISRLNIEIANKDSKLYEDKDIIYENVIDEDSLNEYEEQEFNITTYPGYGKSSYSHVGRKSTGKYFDYILTDGLSPRPVKPEVALMEKLYTQYSTPTKSESLTLDMSFTPQMKIHDYWWEENFAPVGFSIDYDMGRQTIYLTQVKDTIIDNWCEIKRTDIDSISIPYYANKIEVEVDSAFPYTISADVSGFTEVKGDGLEPTKHILSIPGNDIGTTTQPREITITVKNTYGKNAQLKLTQAGHTTNYEFIHFDNIDCIGCTACSSFFNECPVGITMDAPVGQKAIIKNASSCLGCQACFGYIDSCPASCFSKAEEPMS